MSLDHQLEITRRLPNIIFLPPVFCFCCFALATHLFCINETMFLLVDGCLFVGVEPLPVAVRLGRGPCGGVAYSPPNAIEWVADPQVVCRFPPLLRLNGSGTHSHALPLLGRRPCNSLPWLVSGPSFPALLVGRGPANALRARRGLRTLAAVCMHWTAVQMWSIFTQLRS